MLFHGLHLIAVFSIFSSSISLPHSLAPLLPPLKGGTPGNFALNVSGAGTIDDLSSSVMKLASEDVDVVAKRRAILRHLAGSMQSSVCHSDEKRTQPQSTSSIVLSGYPREAQGRVKGNNTGKSVWDDSYETPPLSEEDVPFSLPGLSNLGLEDFDIGYLRKREQEKNRLIASDPKYARDPDLLVEALYPSRPANRSDLLEVSPAKFALAVVRAMGWNGTKQELRAMKRRYKEDRMAELGPWGPKGPPPVEMHSPSTSEPMNDPVGALERAIDEISSNELILQPSSHLQSRRTKILQLGPQT
ncbi:hypothetical protein GUITHDRAFT_137033 [Guillardia theta CCMP2712]|uniref:Uncharacterized protein n=1 Tax=Guillardia theta (strain CCMP2712) TaxID=905079 RepID=L1JHW4_GUITC|nr:hypothetical protein GUITHDRAFT_137033 [Guillardia theta CCMP2712]EKX48086.1 hypothetical protein GUITHDRAFT_137033 [Guillardia theta CCMP2712]|eukprot:XP_005835066.1 hypothetical protein GUITHDRAFT_137033 [Guillardia theta CCMP2712]